MYGRDISMDHDGRGGHINGSIADNWHARLPYLGGRISNSKRSLVRLELFEISNYRNFELSKFEFVYR